MPSLQRSNSGTSLGSKTSKFSASSLTRSLSSAGLGFSSGKSFRFFDPGLSGSKKANSDQDVLQEETGDWKYLVVDVSGIRSRDDASYDDSKRRDAARLKEGTLVEIDRRRKSGWTQWLSLKSGDGWVFDVSPKDKKVRCVEVEVVSGDWQYEAGLQKAPLLTMPSLWQAKLVSRTNPSIFIAPGEVFPVNQRVRPMQMKGSFLRLADGRGWAMDFMDGQQLLHRVHASGDAADHVGTSSSSRDPVLLAPQKLGPAETGDWDYVVVDPNGMALRSGAEYNHSNKLRTRLEEGELVTVVERCAGEGTTWLRLNWPQGWAFDVQPAGQARLRMMEVTLEKGTWYYVVVTNNGIALRNRCAFSDACKIGEGPSKGSFVTVTQRVKVGETTFLHIDGGWVFDVKRGRKLVEGPLAVFMPAPGTRMEVQAEEAFNVVNVPGNGEYASKGPRYVCSPDLTDTDGNRYAPWGSVVHGIAVDPHWLKVGTRFLPRKLNGQRVLQPSQEVGVRLQSAPTDSKSANTKFLILPKAKVEVNMVLQLEGIHWARVTQVGSNMEGWMHQRLLIDAAVQPAQPGFPGRPAEMPSPASHAPWEVHGPAHSSLSSAQAEHGPQQARRMQLPPAWDTHPQAERCGGA